MPENSKETDINSEPEEIESLPPSLKNKFQVELAKRMGYDRKGLLDWINKYAKYVSLFIDLCPEIRSMIESSSDIEAEKAQDILEFLCDEKVMELVEDLMGYKIKDLPNTTAGVASSVGDWFRENSFRLYQLLDQDPEIKSLVAKGSLEEAKDLLQKKLEAKDP